MAVDDSSDGPTVQVVFWPPLYLQRRTWVLNIIRREGVKTVLDIGCGEGSLLSVLCEPSLSLPSGSDVQNSIDAEKILDIYATHIAGLDVSTADLELAVRATAPLLEEGERNAFARWTRSLSRWQDLKVDIWQGGFEVLNEQPGDPSPGSMDPVQSYFGREQWDAVVCTEVVEHLPSDLLKLFFPTILGVYQPPLLLLTTPNYNFNVLFTSPGEQNPEGYPDPTGETDRVFRHHDHRREWREQEWIEWCEDAAEKWGYFCQTESVGSSQEKDPWDREGQAGRASLTAIFRRKGEPPEEDLVAARALALQDARCRSSTNQHRLVANHHFEAHPSSGHPSPAKIILERLAELMEPNGELGYRNGLVTVEELWMASDVGILCGGSVEALLDAVQMGDQCSALNEVDWELVTSLEPGDPTWKEDKWSYRVRWAGYERAKNGIGDALWKEPSSDVDLITRWEQADWLDDPEYSAWPEADDCSSLTACDRVLEPWLNETPLHEVGGWGDSPALGPLSERGWGNVVDSSTPEQASAWYISDPAWALADLPAPL